jgi:hypothetical protein
MKEGMAEEMEKEMEKGQRFGSIRRRWSNTPYAKAHTIPAYIYRRHGGARHCAEHLVGHIYRPE